MTTCMCMPLHKVIILAPKFAAHPNPEKDKDFSLSFTAIPFYCSFSPFPGLPFSLRCFASPTSNFL